MLSPNPFSLFCAILLCFPLALFFTLSSHSSSLSPHPHVTLASLPPPPPLPSPPPSPPLPPPNPPPLPKLIIKRPKTPPKNPHVTLASLPQPPPPSPPPPNPPSLPKGISKLPKTPLKKPTPYQINSTLPKIPLPTPLPPPPPPYPEDDKDDVELLQRASRVNPDPIGGPRKLAFLFLTTAPLPFTPIWEKFFNQSGTNGKYNIYIHTDPRLEYNNTYPAFTGIFRNRVIPSSKPTARNTPTLVAAARRLLAHALLDDPNNYMFTLLSGTCIPLHSFNFTYNTLTSSNKSFIEILSNETTAYSRWAARGDDAMLPEVPLEVFRIGSQFWSLTRHHARVVAADVKLWRKFRLPCVDSGVCFPEENYFPTLLSMVDPGGVVPATLTNVNWHGSINGHPRMYNETEVGPELIRWLRETRPRYGEMEIDGSDLSVTQRWDPFLFARKFAPSCVQQLLNITNDDLFKD